MIYHKTNENFGNTPFLEIRNTLLWKIPYFLQKDVSLKQKHHPVFNWLWVFGSSKKRKIKSSFFSQFLRLSLGVMVWIHLPCFVFQLYAIEYNMPNDVFGINKHEVACAVTFIIQILL